LAVRVNTAKIGIASGEFKAEAAMDKALLKVGLGTCNGCKGLPEPRCVRACPGDLMAIDPEKGTAFCRDDADCWDCFACVKACPRRAIVLRLPYELADHRAVLVPKVRKTSIEWSLVTPDGKIETFTIRTRE